MTNEFTNLPRAGGSRGSGPTVRAAALIITARGLLLVRQRRLERTYWLLPGGGVQIRRVARRRAAPRAARGAAPRDRAGRPLALAEAISDDMARYPKHVVHVIVRGDARPTPRRAPRLGDDGPCSKRATSRARRSPGSTLTPPIAPFLERASSAAAADASTSASSGSPARAKRGAFTGVADGRRRRTLAPQAGPSRTSASTPRSAS